MGYNLWLSEDSRYTLGYRVKVSTQASEAPSAPEPGPDAPEKPSATEMDRIDSLMETLARRIETASP
jgi:hypothetical protein